MSFDLLLTGGRLIDGSGSAERRADIAVRGDRIAAIGALGGAAAREVIDLSRAGAGGLVVCPGFIDAHSHSDTAILLDPGAGAKLSQGVTTEICGNCGASCAPVTSWDQLPSDWAAWDYGGRKWSSLAAYRTVLESCGPAVNIGLLTGHNTLRRQVAGMGADPAEPDAVARMGRLLEAALDAGSLGFSTGLEYPPGMHAPRDEVIALAGLAGRHGRLYATHMRNEGDRVTAAVEEALATARQAGVRLQISHLKVLHQRNWHQLDGILAALDAAGGEGIDVAADAYPYIACATDLDVILPPWFHADGREPSLARLADPAARARLLAHLREAVGTDVLAGITIAGTVAQSTHGFQGCRLTTVGESLGLPLAETVLELCRRDGLRTGAFFEGIAEAGMRRILERPDVAVGSDASLRTLDGPLHNGYPHPRTFGTFPRFLRLVREGRLKLDLPEAIRKLTALPAERFRLPRRGLLREGYAADIVAFDAARITDRATFHDPWRMAEGVAYVVVNGALSLTGGSLTGRRGGRFVSP